jgi:hypothetical protein
VFFGLDILIFAYLVLRSTFLPRAIGVLLAIDGLAYLCYSVTDILAPGAAAHLVPWIQLPALVGEGALCLWLLVVGLDVDRGTSRRARHSGCSPPNWRHYDEHPQVRGCASSPAPPASRLAVRPGAKGDGLALPSDAVSDAP